MGGSALARVVAAGGGEAGGGGVGVGEAGGVAVALGAGLGVADGPAVGADGLGEAVRAAAPGDPLAGEGGGTTAGERVVRDAAG